MEGSTPTVLFGEGHGPESSTHVRFEEFEGPLALLLSLIEARRLDILTVPYLEALAMLPGDRLGNISSFVTVASQLILIKSRALLPPRGDSTVTGGEALDDAPDPEAELRARLLLYRAYRDAGSALQERVTGASGLFRREPAAAQAAAIAGARAPQRAPLDVGLLVDGLGLLIRIVPPPEPPPEVLARSVTVEERAAIIRMALRGAGVVVLQDILGGGTGGRRGLDGMNAVDTYVSNCGLLSAEVCETLYPWRVERTELIPDSAGAGRFRGGLGLRRTYRAPKR